MRNVQNLLNECDIKDSLLLLLAGIPKKRFAKMLEVYYSFYCMAKEAWYGDDAEAYLITDFTHEQFVEGKEKYDFYGRNGKASEKVLEVKIDWNQVLLGKTKVFIPECIDNVLKDELLAAMVLNQMYEHSTIDIQKNTNKKLFEYIMNQPRDKKSKISASESLLESKIHYLMDKCAVNNAILEYQESQASSLKWGSLLKNTETSIPDRIMRSNAGGRFLDNAMRKGTLPKVYRWFKQMDKDNPPDLRRIHRSLARLRSVYEEIELSDYTEVKNGHKRIIVEANETGKGFPVVYIRDGKGNRTEIKDVRISELLCMDVRVLDPALVDSEQVLALLVFCLEYPIRVERIQKHYFLQSIVGMTIMTLGESMSLE